MSADAVSVTPATSGPSAVAPFSLPERKKPGPKPRMDAGFSGKVELEPGRYWVGLTTDPRPPREAVTFAGICFPRQTFTARQSEESVTTYDVPRDGDYIDLIQDDIDKLRAARERKIYRCVSQKSGLCHILLMKGSNGYRPIRGDIPLEDCLLLRRMRGLDEEGFDEGGRHGGEGPVCLANVA